jgi:hypothetical protein
MKTTIVTQDHGGSRAKPPPTRTGRQRRLRRQRRGDPVNVLTRRPSRLILPQRRHDIVEFLGLVHDTLTPSAVRNFSSAYRQRLATVLIDSAVRSATS